MIREVLGIIVSMLDSESVPRFQCFSRTERALVNQL